MSLTHQITELEQRINRCHMAAQHANGSDYSNEMATVNSMRFELKKLKELAANDTFDPFADEQPASNDAGRIITPGYYTDLSNEQYHSSEGISKSGLDRIADNPTLHVWHQQAPVDTDKLAALDMGTALHCLLLEPDEFDKRFVQAPDVNKRTNAGKEEHAAFIEEVKSGGKTVLEHDDHIKLMIMRESVMAHPVARALFEAEGENESSIYWIDKETGELCKCRPDRLTSFNGQPVILDVKKVDGIDRFPQHVADFRYDVQDAMYSDGYCQHFGEKPLFWFLYASTTISAGRYPVDVRALPEDWKLDGYAKYRENLNTYHHCRQDNDWLHLPEIKRPRWA